MCRLNLASIFIIFMISTFISCGDAFEDEDIHKIEYRKERILVTTSEKENDITIKLGDKLSRLEKLYGKATPGNSGVENVYSFNSRFGDIEVRLDQSNHVIQIYVLDSRYTTRKGIRVGSLRHEVRSAHGFPTRTTNITDFYRVWVNTATDIGYRSFSFGYFDNKVVLIAINITWY